MSRLPLFALPLLLLACGSSEETPLAVPRVCAPGATQTCVCASGTGAQSCDASGTSWGECSCGTDTSTSSATGSDSGTSTSTGTRLAGQSCETAADCLPLAGYEKAEVFSGSAKVLCKPIGGNGENVCTFTCEFNSDHGNPGAEHANPCTASGKACMRSLYDAPDETYYCGVEYWTQLVQYMAQQYPSAQGDVCVNDCRYPWNCNDTSSPKMRTCQ